MSGIFSAIGKAFKSVFNIVKKVALPALAIGAVVLTGGAALGVLPAVGSVIGGLGLSAGVTAALTSAVTMAGWGGLAGLVTGGVKGLEKGALIGGLTGGLLGVAGGALGGASSIAAPTAAEMAGSAPSIASTNLITGTAETMGAAAPAAAAASAAPAVATATAPGVLGGGGGGGLLNGLLGNGGIGSILSGLGQGESAAAQAKAEQEAFDHKQKAIAANYDTSNSFLSNSLLSPYATPGYIASPQLDAYQGTTQWMYDPEQQKMVRKYVAVQPGSGAPVAGTGA